MHLPFVSLAAEKTADTTYMRSAKASPKTNMKKYITGKPNPAMYLSVFLTWLACLIWFDPKLFSLFGMADNGLKYFALVAFILFIDIAWLYGIYNIALIVFAYVYRAGRNGQSLAIADTFTAQPPVAVLYTTANDFVPESAMSCLKQNYPSFTLYILDDSSDESFKKSIDEFASQDTKKIKVVRRADRSGFKAGNMNHALAGIASKEKYFAIADADEILPPNFLEKLVSVMEQNPSCGFIQANHEANPAAVTHLQKDMAAGINTHWKWHQPLRNRFGFVMFLGHGALLRHDCWKEVGGFPHIVSEDLGFAIAAREKGYRGYFEENIICYEDFPDTVRAFRIRHMKWTRGTCEFLHKKFWWLVKAKNISLAEKADILFPTLNLPLTLLFMLFMVNTNILMPSLFGHAQPLTVAAGSNEYVFSVIRLNTGFSAIYTWDFFLITILTFFSPVFCFIIEMGKRPLKLFRFLSFSTALYAALSILSSIGVLAYLVTGKATFLVTGDKNQGKMKRPGINNGISKFNNGFRALINKSHPDFAMVQFIEITVALIFMWAGIRTMQVSFFGLCLAFILLPLLHHWGWENRTARVVSFLPFLLILAGVFLSGLSLFGMQSVFFGYGFHF